MTVMRALADDLTGAFDAGAAFVGLCGPITVAWRGADVPARGSMIFDNETRGEIDAEVASARTRNDLARLDTADIVFKKIDSLMRGHTLAELRACLTGAGFASIVLAPSFPQQDRITRDAQQFARFGAACAWRPVGPNLAAAFPGSQRVGAAARASGAGLFVCDAQTADEMLSLPERLADLAPPVLWCGSAGLARALSSSPTRPSTWPSGPALVVVGSPHPVSRAQLAGLAIAMPGAVCLVDLDRPPAEAADFIAARLASGRTAVVAMAFAATDPVVAHRRIEQAVHDLLPRLPIPERFVVMGGETLLMILEATGARSAVATGEIRPGVAVGHAVGGRWEGVVFACKSGAFGPPSLLVELLTESMPGRSA